MTPKKSYRRGYPVAILLGLEENSAAAWQVFSKVVKPLMTLQLKGKRSDTNDVYNFHESIINALRLTFKQGVRSVILASPSRTSYARDFLDHVTKHHSWLIQGPNKIAFVEVTGSANTPPSVAALTRTQGFQKLISETTSQETLTLLELLNARISTASSSDFVLYSLEEAENLILKSNATGKVKPEFLLLTDKYLAENPQKGRLNRLLQIASNKNIKSRIIDSESPAGKRLKQLGGFVCLTQPAISPKKN